MPDELNPVNWPPSSAGLSMGVGGTAAYRRVNAVLAFYEENGERHLLSGPIELAESRPDNQWLPSILGWDFLRYFRSTFDAQASTVELEWLGS